VVWEGDRGNPVPYPIPLREKDVTACTGRR
jgi:hypothetical protein